MDSLQQEIERVRQQRGGFGGPSPRRNGNQKIDFNSSLEPGEVILWEGEGKAPKNSGSSGCSQRFFAIFWLGFSIFWTVGATAGGGLFGLFGVPFILIGIVLLFKKDPKPHYAITNMKVMSDVNGFFNTTPYETITSARIQHDNDGTADIYFTVEHPVSHSSQRDMYVAGGYISKIQDGDRVYSIFERAVFDRKKAIENNLNQ